MDGPIAHVAEDGRVHGLEEHLWGTEREKLSDFY